MLERWSGRDDLDARGALLFRRFGQRALAARTSPFRVPFDPNDPVNTPKGLNTESPAVRQALRDAIGDLQAAGLPLDAPLSAWQYETRGERIPLHGGLSQLGSFNVLQTTFDPAKGYTGVTAGQTYIQAVQFTGNKRCGVRGDTNLGHSLSTDPTSPWYANGTKQISRKGWTRQPFCEAELARTTKLEARYGTAKPKRPRLVTGVKLRGGKVAFRLSARARVTIRVSRRGRTVKTLRRTLGKGRHGVRLRINGGGRTYRVRVTGRRTR